MIQGPGQFSQALGGMLDKQLDACAALAQLLAEERGALEAGQADELDRITAGKTELLGQLEQQVTEQAALLTGAGFEASGTGLRKAIGWCDPSGRLARQQKRLEEQLGQCSEQNSRNGLLVQFRIGFVRRALHSIRGQHFGGGTYGKDGRCGLETGQRLLGSG